MIKLNEMNVHYVTFQMRNGIRLKARVIYDWN